MTEPVERALVGSALPCELADLDEPPVPLYVRGELPRGPRVAIVGTRKPTPRAARYARLLAAQLARAGVAVLSGGAKGIDAAVHEGALDVGGVSVVVAPASFDRAYPPEHLDLFQRVVAGGGAYATHLPPDSPAGYATFFRRNAILAALAHVLVVAEAGVRSGARNAARHARRLGRPVFAVPAPPWNPRGRGCIIELELGARPLTGAKDVLELLSRARLHVVAVGGSLAGRLPASGPVSPIGGPSENFSALSGAGLSSVRPNSLVPSRPAQQSLGFSRGSADDGDAARVLESVRAGAAHADEVCARTGLAVARVQEILLTLALKGVLVPDSMGRLKLLNLQDY